MKRTNKIFLVPMFLFLIVFIAPALLAEQDCVSKPSPKPLNLSSTTTGDPQLDKAEFARKTKKLQIPFVANNGQVDDHVRFYAKTFGGTVFVTKDGEIVYALPSNSSELRVRGSENQEAR